MSTTDLLSAPPRPVAPPPRRGFNLLGLRPLGALVRWAGFPYVFQALLLVACVLLAALAWNVFPPADVEGKVFAKSNLVTLLIWGLWWPAMIWVAVFFGRVWCAVCPLELVANGTERLGRLLGVRQRTLGRWLRAGWLIVALYALLQMLVAGVHLHRVPAYTSLFLWGLLGAAALVGFLYEDRAFCRAFCPAGLLLGTYGRGSMLAVRSSSTERCTACTDRGCVRGCDRTKLDARSCPSLLHPGRLESNADCLVCGQCVKSCPSDDMGIFLRPPFARGDLREKLVSWPVLLFVMLVSGFVIYELFSEWKAAKALFLAAPVAVTRWLAADGYAGWIQGAWTLFVVPLLVWTVLGGLVLLLRGAESMTEAWRRLALPLVVVIAFGHMSKGLAKFASWGGYLPGAASDPRGVETAQALGAKANAAPASLLPIVLVSTIAVVLIVTATGYAVREVRLAQGAEARRYFAPVLAFAAFSLFLVFGWGLLP